MNAGPGCCSRKTPDIALSPLAARRGDFLSFVERRVKERAFAEDILQDAFAKASEHKTEVRDDAAMLPWFYRILRNAIVDAKRRRQARTNATDRLELETPTHTEPVERVARPCPCVAKVMETLKPEYRDALKRIDVDGVSVKAFADEAGISATNAGVRIHRARAALRTKLEEKCGHCAEGGGCIDCACD